MGLLLAIHIIICFLLVVVVLLQSGKSADLAGAFGGYGSQSTFGPRGTATFLSKLTTFLAIGFMLTSLLLWIFSSKQSDNPSRVRDSKVKHEQRVDEPKPTLPSQGKK